jgi:hypothetical protein
LYRGFSTSSLQLVVQQQYVFTYEYLRAADRYSDMKSDFTPSEPIRNGISAAVSVFLSQIIANPIDVVAQRLMLQGQIRSNEPMQSQQATSVVTPVAAGATTPTSTVISTKSDYPLSARDLARYIYRTHGIKGFYSAFLISCGQYMPSASLWWTSYPIYRDTLLDSFTQMKENDSVPSYIQVLPIARVSEVLAGSFASATVAIAMNPLDIIRTRAQVDVLPARFILRSLLQNEGFLGLFKGISARVLMLVPQGALSVTAYEFVKRMSALTPTE